MDMGGQPKFPLYGDSDEDLANLGILPLPGEQGRTTADRTAANGAGTIELPPADHGVKPSHPMDDQFCSFPPFSTNGCDFGTVYVLT